MNERITELQQKVHKMDSMSAEEIYNQYVNIKNSLDSLTKIFSREDMEKLKISIAEYENRHGIR